MKSRYLFQTLVASLIAAVAYVANAQLALEHGPGWLWTLLFAPAIPAKIMNFMLGLGTGAHGMPLPFDYIPVTFLMWWIAIGKILSLAGLRRQQ